MIIIVMACTRAWTSVGCNNAYQPKRPHIRRAMRALISASLISFTLRRLEQSLDHDKVGSAPTMTVCIQLPTAASSIDVQSAVSVDCCS